MRYIHELLLKFLLKIIDNFSEIFLKHFRIYHYENFDAEKGNFMRIKNEKQSMIYIMVNSTQRLWGKCQLLSIS